MSAQPFLDKVLDLLLDMICVVDAEGHVLFVSAACEKLLGYTQGELIGRKMIDFVHPEDRERTLAAAANVMRGRFHTHFENRYLRKDGGVVHLMWSARWSEQDRVRMAVARDITELKHAARMQSAIYRISEAAYAAEGLLELYRLIHEIIGDLLPAHNFFVALYDESNGTVSFPYFVDERQERPEPQPLAPGTRLAEVIREGSPLLADFSDGDHDAGGEPAGAGEIRNWLGVPLISQKGVVGALVVRTYFGRAKYTREDRELLQFVSTQVAAAIERKQGEARLRHMAGHDALTGLANRLLFHDLLDVALKRARRHGERLALLFLDLDGFKAVNDTCGHDVGDLLLHAVARRLARCVRDSDVVGRMGGDEFTVLLTGIDGADPAGGVVAKIRETLGEPFELDGRRLTVSASVGVALYPDHGEDQEQLFRHADAAMYTEKRRAG